jgi:hypothetical protein
MPLMVRRRIQTCASSLGTRAQSLPLTAPSPPACGAEEQGPPKDLLSAAQHVAFLSYLTVELPGATAFVESLTDGLVVAALEALQGAMQVRYAACPSNGLRPTSGVLGVEPGVVSNR